MTPRSTTALPATLWPLLRIETSKLCVRAKLTALMTSAVPAQRTIKEGLRSINPL